MEREYYGKLLKREILQVLTSNDYQGSLVLDAPEPFPGCFSYYSDVPVEQIPLFVYLVLDKDYGLESILRASMQVRQDLGIAFSASHAQISIAGKEYFSIRIKHIENYQLLPQMLKAYKEAGLCFKTPTRTEQGGEAYITVTNFFHVTEQENKLYIGKSNQDYGYFQLPKYLDWDDFEALVKEVKNNYHDTYFDVALVQMYEQEEVKDMIRVYHPKMNIELLKEIQAVFLQRL